MANKGNTGANINKKRTWFWNQIANQLESNSKYNRYSDLEGDLGSEAEEKEFKTEKKAFLQNWPREIKWNKKGEKSLREVYR